MLLLNNFLFSKINKKMHFENVSSPLLNDLYSVYSRHNFYWELHFRWKENKSDQ